MQRKESKGMKKASRSWLVFLCCLLGVPTAVNLMPTAFAVESPERAVAAGVVLGFFHVLLRPVLRLVSAPIGCLTLGLAGIAIDVGLIYGCARFVDGFEVLSLPFALITALFINVICFVVSGRK